MSKEGERDQSVAVGLQLGLVCSPTGNGVSGTTDATVLPKLTKVAETYARDVSPPDHARISSE
jgi:hypothetical protein